MKIYSTIIFLFVFIIADAQKSNLNGSWTGSVSINKKIERIDLQLIQESSKLNYPLINKMSPVTLITQNSLTMLVTDTDTLTIKASSNSKIEGTIKSQIGKGTFSMVKLADVDPDYLQKINGFYEISKGNFIQIILNPFRGLSFIHNESGRTGALFPIAKNIFINGPAVAFAAPEEIRIRVIEDNNGGVNNIEFTDSAMKTVSAKKLNFYKEEIEIQNGDIKLSGTLTLPNGKGPFPLMVRIHGAGPATRINFGEDQSAYKGIAFFSYDKRGSGKSTGKWNVGIEALASDALMVVHKLKTDKRIDSNKVGLGAGSEGGWVAPVVAAKDGNIAFLLLGHCPILSFREEFFLETKAVLEGSGLKSKDLKDALAMYSDFFKNFFGGALLDSISRMEYNKKVKIIYGDKSWYKEHGIHLKPAMSEWNIKNYENRDFDPSVYWLKLKIPIYTYWGSIDVNVPYKKNLQRFLDYMEVTNNINSKWRVIQSANHEGLLYGKSGFLGESVYLKYTQPAKQKSDFDEWLQKIMNVKNK